MVIISIHLLLEDNNFRNFVKQESEIYHKNIGDIYKLINTNFIIIIALSQFGEIHDISLYSAVKREFKKVKYEYEVMAYYPIINTLSIKYGIRPRTVILALITSILYEKTCITSKISKDL
ncbi:hypothetical protein bcgnr5378_52960 [Bacillus cereus]